MDVNGLLNTDQANIPPKQTWFASAAGTNLKRFVFSEGTTNCFGCQPMLSTKFSPAAGCLVLVVDVVVRLNIAHAILLFFIIIFFRIIL